LLEHKRTGAPHALSRVGRRAGQSKTRRSAGRTTSLSARDAAANTHTHTGVRARTRTSTHTNLPHAHPAIHTNQSQSPPSAVHLSITRKQVCTSMHTHTHTYIHAHRCAPTLSHTCSSQLASAVGSSPLSTATGSPVRLLCSARSVAVFKLTSRTSAGTWGGKAIESQVCWTARDHKSDAAAAPPRGIKSWARPLPGASRMPAATARCRQ
jgi:hypothetical protein